MRRARGRVIRLAVLVLATGAGVSWAVAWWLAIYRPTDGGPNVLGRTADQWNTKYRVPQYRFPTPAGDIFVDWTGGWGYDTVSLAPLWTREMTPEDHWLFTTYPYAQDIRSDVRDVFLREGWSGTCAVPAWAASVDAASTDLNVISYAWGWPMRCLASEQRTGWDGPNPVTRRFAHVHSSSVQPLVGVTHGRVRGLPTRVLWAGMVVNTVFFGIMTLAIAVGGTRLIRARRQRRGNCATCGYSREGLAPDTACPECGRAGVRHAGSAPTAGVGGV